MSALTQWAQGLLLGGCAVMATAQTPATAPKDASASTRAIHHSLLAQLPMADKRSFADAERGLIEAFGDQVILDAKNNPVWSLKPYGFLAAETAPDSVNPALWRHARANMANGLFQVTERIYQVRGVDLANMTIIEGDSGLIVIDPLTTVEVAQAALALYYKHRPQKPVNTVIYTHSHVDHFGGVRGVVQGEDVASGKVKIIAPAGFMQEATSENVIAGNAMSRRSLYQFGALLAPGEKGQVDAGLGKTSSRGTVTLIAPTQLVTQPIETHRIDGVDIVFELTPGAEAPAEMITYYPQFKVLNMAEIASQTFHNLLPMRGAQVRDGLIWSKYFSQALGRYGADSQIMIAQHNWPVWGSADIQKFLKVQRDAYKFLHDQTLRLINYGYIGTEIADMLTLPASLAQDWSTHFFYGDLKHNIKATYQRYLGYYDGNPANLHALPPVAAGKKALEYMGGSEAVIQRARQDLAQGQYRWVAQVMSQVVFAEPQNQAARQLGADALEQMGYQAESATARNAFLQGAFELRHGMPAPMNAGTAAPDVLRALPLDLYFDYLAVRINGDKAAGKKIVLNWRFTDTQQNFVLNLENSALTHSANTQDAHADATVSLSRTMLDEISLNHTSFAAAIQSGQIAIAGEAEKVSELLGLVEVFPTMFPIVEPRPQR